MSRFSPLVLVAGLLAAPAALTQTPKEPLPPPAWPMLGGTPARNMANLHDRLEKLPQSGPGWGRAEDKTVAAKWEAEWLVWKAPIGCMVNYRSGNSSSPVVSNGRVFIGTNNGQPRNPRDIQKHRNGETESLDMGVLMCFEEKTGKFRWQAVHDKLESGRVNDWPGIGLTSTPSVVGDRVYYVSNRCTVVCADVNGFADGNQGSQNERYKDASDADILWEYDVIRELKVFPHKASNCAPLIVGDRVFVCTSNGLDDAHVTIPSPDAPTLICLDRLTGKLLWKDASPGKSIMHAQWCSPSFAETPVPHVIHGWGDGWLRGFDPATGKLLWQFDCNRKGTKWELGSLGTRNELVAMPVVQRGRVYIGTGMDPEHSSGIAHLWCIDLKKAVELGARAKDRDVSPELVVGVKKQNGEETPITNPNPASALVWVYGGAEVRNWAPREEKFGRTVSTVAVVEDVVYATELHGYIHCLNANTGEMHWQYDMKAAPWGSPYYVDGKVLVGTDSGDLHIFRHDRQPKKFDGVQAASGAPDRKAAREIHKAQRAEVGKEYLLAKLEFDSPIRTTPTVVNRVLYVATEKTLYAIRTR